MKDLRCVDILLYFEIHKSDLYSNNMGYAEIVCEGKENIEIISNIDKYNNFVLEQRKTLAKDLGVSLSDVISISKEEYLEAVGEDEEL